MISSIVEDKVLDWKWKRYNYRYTFFIGDIFIGQVFNMDKLGWTALHRDHQPIGLVEGFKTKYAASHFLLKFEPNINY